ncbi:MAG: PD40 domain-containing protein [Sedimentisphaerales bacterium]|nr:PD40 domain-containing protein [Sedimentisphaerales bacterium]
MRSSRLTAKAGIFISLVLVLFCCGWVNAAQLDALNVLAVDPNEDFLSSGDPGGPFDPVMKEYILTNTSDTALFWGVEADADWVDYDPDWGSLGAGQSITLTVSLNAETDQLVSGEHRATLTLTDITHDQQGTVDVILNVGTFPGVLTVTPSDPFLPIGIYGGPFTPDSKIYTLSNTGGARLFWSLDTLPDWLSADRSFGQLDPEGTVQVTASLTEQANTMEIGSHTETILFNNLSAQTTITRVATLQVRAAVEKYAEFFTNHDFDLSNSSILFRPDGSASYFAACRQGEVKQFPVDPAGGTYLVLFDDDMEEIELADEATICFYGQEYDRVFIGSNGYITFGEGDTEAVASWNNHFDLPRISAFFADLSPVSAEHISYQQLADRFVVTYENLPLRINKELLNSFQVSISLLDGSIEITWLNCDAKDEIIVGLSRGYGISTAFQEGNLSGLMNCCACGDLTGDSIVGPEDLVILADWWLGGDCSSSGWCGRADLDRNVQVDMADLGILAGNWRLGEFDWSQPTGHPELNIGTDKGRDPCLSADFLTIYFQRYVPALSQYCIVQGTRQDSDEPFLTQRVLSELNVTGNAGSPWISRDGLRLYYWENTGGVSMIKMAQRASTDQVWTPSRTFSELHTGGIDGNGCALTEDEQTIFFHSNRTGSAFGDYNLWTATRGSLEEPFESPRPLDEINTDHQERSPYPSPDGLILYFDSDREGSHDLFVTQRTALDEPFGPAERVSVSVNNTDETKAFISVDGSQLWFSGSGGIQISRWTSQIRDDWGEPVLLAELNDGENYAFSPTLTADELLVVYTRDDPASGYPRLFEATREDPNGPFTGERMISELLSSGLNIGFPWISSDGLRLYYWELLVSGTRYIKLATRSDRSQPWTYVRTLTELDPTGEGGNMPSLTSDELIIVYSSYKTGSSYGTAKLNLWMATRESVDQPFAQSWPLDELNSSYHESGPHILSNGLVLYFTSNCGPSNGEDVYVATRASRSDLFGNVQKISISTEENKEMGPWITDLENKLYYFIMEGVKPYGIWLSQKERIIEECLPR